MTVAVADQVRDLARIEELVYGVDVAENFGLVDPVRTYGDPAVATVVCVCSDGSYDTKEGLITSFPIRSDGTNWSIVEGVAVNDFARRKIDASVAELAEERSLVGDLLPG